MARKTVADTAVDPTVKYVKLSLGKETYSLVFDFNAIALAEASDPGLDLLHSIDLQNLNSRQLRGLFFAALSKAHPKMTIEQAGALINLVTLRAITTAIGDAWLASLPDAPENPREPEADPA